MVTAMLNRKWKWKAPGLFQKDFNSAHIDSGSLMRENTVLARMWVWAVRKRKIKKYMTLNWISQHWLLCVGPGWAKLLIGWARPTLAPPWAGPAALCDWIQDFLTGRPQVVKVGQFTSNSITLNVGAPQGCVLSPLLYSLYQGRAETFGGAGAQSIKGAHGTQLLIGLCSLLICVSKWMLLYWYSSKCHEAGLKKKHRTEKTILSLNVKYIFCNS